jgi:hypothetical protein
MTNVTLAQLMQRVRQRANLEGANSFITDPELIDVINVCIAEWWDLVTLTTFMGQYGRSTWPILTVNDQSLYPLAPNHSRVISVDANIEGNSYAISAMPYQEEQRNMFKLLPFVGWSFGIQSVWYQQQGTNINFLPAPTAGYNVVVNYLPTAPVLNSPQSDSLNSINGWEEHIVLNAAINLLVKAGLNDMVGTLQARMDRQTARIEAAAGQADLNASEGVREVEAFGNWGNGAWWM